MSKELERANLPPVIMCEVCKREVDRASVTYHYDNGLVGLNEFPKVTRLTVTITCHGEKWEQEFR